MHTAACMQTCRNHAFSLSGFMEDTGQAHEQYLQPIKPKNEELTAFRATGSSNQWKQDLAQPDNEMQSQT